MKIFKIFKARKPSTGNGNGRQCVFTSLGCDFFSEEAFGKVLRLERHRSDRSGKHFFLVLISIADHIHETQRVKIMRKLANVFIRDTRDIDVKGWYRKDRIVGIIVSETNGTKPSGLEKAMQRKFSDSLREEECTKLTISVHVYPEKDEDKGERETLIDEHLYPELTEEDARSNLSIRMKRVMDVAGALAAILIFSPFLVAIPILIRLESKGPVFFRQKRMGHLGRNFTLLKFRSMKVDNDPSVHREYVASLIRGQNEGDDNGDGEKVFKIQNDPRVTRVGRFIRKTSLDELPQFFNVLKGDMSLVGPRPPIPYEVVEYDAWHRRRVTDIKPGITGLWQVHGRSSTTFAEMVRLDLQYAREHSLLMDLKILLQTPLAMVTSRGAH